MRRKDRYEGGRKSTLRNATTANQERVEIMANADFDCVPSLAEAMGLEDVGAKSHLLRDGGEREQAGSSPVVSN